MITIFNRKELIITMDLNVQTETRYILSVNNIDYVVKTTNTQSAPFLGNRRGYVGSFGIDPDYSYEYKIFVHRDDYEKASRLIRDIKL